ncbi:MAG: sortase-associated OmpA-like protein PdsO [Gammaproteobacteria bacterium]
MTKKLPLVLLLSLSAGSVFADTELANYNNPASVEETTGFFSGALVGGLAGGPPGAIVGAAIGALTGDGFRARKDIGDMQADLYAAQLESKRAKQNEDAMRTRYQLAQQQLNELRNNSARTIPAYLPNQPTSAPVQETALSVHFRSGSSTIEAQYEEQLQYLVKVAKDMPNARVEITGYADRTGDAQKNLELSRARSSAIKSYFNSMGVQNSAITTVAYGESQPLHEQQTLETDFFDRRVNVRLRDTSQQMLTQNPESE